MPFQEVVEAEGHLIDSHIMENIFDKVVEYHGRFEVEQFRIGRTNSEPSYLRLKVEAPDGRIAGAPAGELLGLGCAPVDAGDAALRDGGAGPLRAGGFLLHHQPPHLRAHRRAVDRSGKPAHGRHDRGARRARLLPPPARSAAGDRIVVGLRGIRVVPESKERDRLAFAFMSNGISSERQVETAVRQTAALVAQAIEQKLKVVVVAGPVVVHTGGVAGLAALIRSGFVHARAERQRAGRARRRSGAVRHLAGRAALRRPPGGARPPQPHARHQRHLSRGVGARAPWRAAGCDPAFCTNACRPACRSCWPAACATTARCPTPSPT